MSTLEITAMWLGILYFCGLLLVGWDVFLFSVPVTARGYRYLTSFVIAAVGVMILLDRVTADAPGLAPWQKGSIWNNGGVIVLFGLSLLGLGYVLEDVGEELLTGSGRLKSHPKHFRLVRWLTDHADRRRTL